VNYRLETRLLLCALVSAIATALLAPSLASAQDASNGGATYVPPPPPAKRAKIVNGQAIPPVAAPASVKKAIAAANAITSKPYVWGGGHKPYAGTSQTGTPVLDRGYDCSGAVSMALYGGKLLKSPLDSSSFMNWGAAGKGRWITVYTNPGHAYIVIAGLRFDTSAGDRAAPQERLSGSGPRWRKYSRKPAGFQARHPKNL
jgi:cell wall-associated NlpC family hydrolase